MSKVSEKGLVQVLLLLLILVGIGLGVYLIQQQTALKSHASVTAPENSISLVGYFAEPRQAVPIENPEVNVIQNTDFGVDILVKTNPDAISTVSAKIKYDPAIFDIESVNSTTTRQSSIIKKWIKTLNDSSTGVIYLIGNISSPGYTNNPAEAGFVTRITLRANPGTTGKTSSLEFQEDGTTLLRSLNNQPIPQVIKRNLVVHITNSMGSVVNKAKSPSH